MILQFFTLGSLSALVLPLVPFLCCYVYMNDRANAIIENNAETERPNTSELKILSYNVYTILFSPNIKARFEEIGETIFNGQYDIIFYKKYISDPFTGLQPMF
eukprot:UN16130